MKAFGFSITLAAVLLVAGASWAGCSTVAFGKAEIRDAGDNLLGFVTFTEADAVYVSFNITGLRPGAHAFHIHETGKCEPPFKSAGGHFNPFGREHGIKNPKGQHAGDMPNIVSGSDGVAAGVYVNGLVTMREGDNSLFKPGGTAIVIHESADDYVTDPAGAAGERIACGVIQKLK